MWIFLYKIPSQTNFLNIVSKACLGSWNIKCICFTFKQQIYISYDCLFGLRLPLKMFQNCNRTSSPKLDNFSRFFWSPNVTTTSLLGTLKSNLSHKQKECVNINVWGHYENTTFVFFVVIAIAIAIITDFFFGESVSQFFRFSWFVDVIHFFQGRLISCIYHIWTFAHSFCFFDDPWIHFTNHVKSSKLNQM